VASHVRRSEGWREFRSDGADLCDRWRRLTSAFASFNGLVPEKFDAVNLSHNVEAEYGNQGKHSRLLY
jgi:alpha,alpha-trehalase